jgi:hypothetical protein
MIQNSFITSPDLSGMQAAKGHYLLMHGHLRGFDAFIEDVIDFSGLGDFIHLPMKGYSEGMGARLLFRCSPQPSMIVWLWMRALLLAMPVSSSGPSDVWKTSLVQLVPCCLLAMQMSSCVSSVPVAWYFTRARFYAMLLWRKLWLITMNNVLRSLRYAWNSRQAWWFTATARTSARFARTALGSFWLGLSNLFSIAALALVYGTVFKVQDFPRYVV